MAPIKHYATDIVKAKARELQYEFYQNYLVHNPKKMRVWCFPGIDGAELPMYEKLGIPLANITGFEREPKIAIELMRQFPGLNVVPNSIEDYLATKSEIDVHLLSVDYTQPFGPTEMYFLRDFARKNWTNTCIVHVANLAKRDQQINKDAMHAGHYNNKLQNLSSIPIDEASLIFRKTLGEVYDGFDGIDANIAEYRDDIYSGSITAAFDAIDLSRVKVFSTRFEHIIQNLRTQLRDYDTPLEIIAHRPGFPVVLTASMIDYYFDKLGILRDQSPESNVFQIMFSYLVSTLLGPKKGTYSFIANERYRYVSESGSPMFGDLFMFTRYSKATKIMEEFAQIINKDHVNYRLLNNAIRNLQKIAPSMSNVQEYSPRKDLGSAAKPRLTMKRAKQLAQDGASFNDIVGQYSIGKNFSPQRFAAIKAHTSMGTYAERKVDYSTDEKKAIIDLIIDARKSGASELEVAISLGIPMAQFRAFKAIATRMQNNASSD